MRTIRLRQTTVAIGYRRQWSTASVRYRHRPIDPAFIDLRGSSLTDLDAWYGIDRSINQNIQCVIKNDRQEATTARIEGQQKLKEKNRWADQSPWRQSGGCGTFCRRTVEVSLHLFRVILHPQSAHCLAACSPVDINTNKRQITHNGWRRCQVFDVIVIVLHVSLHPDCIAFQSHSLILHTANLDRCYCCTPSTCI